MDNQPTLPKDLDDQVKALRAIATTHNLLDSGRFTHQELPLIITSLKFLRSLHKQVLDSASIHPDAHLVPELKSLKEKENNQKVEEENA